MKLVLTLMIAGILLLGCTDSKENTSVENKVVAQIATRTIAQNYQVTASQKGGVDCYPDLSKKQANKLSLKDGQHVALVSGRNATLLVNKTQWLHVYADSNKQQPCYVQILYLNPVPDY